MNIDKKVNKYLVILICILCLLSTSIYLIVDNILDNRDNRNNTINNDDKIIDKIINEDNSNTKDNVINSDKDTEQDTKKDDVGEDITNEVKHEEVKDNIIDDKKEDKGEVKEDITNDNKVDDITSMEKINNELRNSIKNTYGVWVGYKDEIDGNYVNSYANPTREYDDEVINQELHRIEIALAKYPRGFFNEIKSKWKQVTIYLVKNINGSVAGLTDNRNPNTVIILINTGGLLFESTLHHEMMHYIDCYLANIVGADTLENSMNKYNPDGFVYGNQSNEYVYYYDNPAYFLSSYSKSNYKEDRAVLFADMMCRALRKDYFSSGNPISDKMKEIAMELEEYFDTVSSNNIETWERFLEW